MSKKQLTFFTIVAKNYFSYANTLCESIKSIHPESKIYLAVSDEIDSSEYSKYTKFDVININQLKLPDFKKFCFRYDVMELSTAIKPYVFKWIFENTEAENVIYLDPDILVLGRLDKVTEILDEGSAVVITPHITSRVDDGLHPDEKTMLKVGVFNLGFIAISSSKSGYEVVNWWANRLERGAINDLSKGLFTDQKWIDLVPCLFSNVSILRDPGFNVAYWNLHERAISFENSIWLANGEPIKFFHFSGIDLKNIEKFSKHQNRYSLRNIGILKDLYIGYAKKLIENKYHDLIKLPYGFNLSPQGLVIDKQVREYFKKFHDVSGSKINDPYHFYTKNYFNEPENSLGKRTLITKYMYGLFLSQPDLRMNFNLNNYRSQEIYSRYFIKHSSNTYGIDHFFIDGALSLRNKNLQFIRADFIPSFFKKVFLRAALCGYKISPTTCKYISDYLLPNDVRERLKDSLARSRFDNLSVDNKNNFLKHLLLKLLGLLGTSDKLKDTASSISFDSGSTLIGYATGDFGVAQNLRSAAHALSSAHYPLDIVEISTGGLYDETNVECIELIVEKSTKKIELFCVNADQTKNVSEQLAETGHTKKPYRIGYWFWELSNFPDQWLHAFNCVDEIWAPTEYIATTLSGLTTKPVIHMPVAVEFNEPRSYTRLDFALPEDNFLFLFSYDFHSFATRKNPEAVLSAFLKAFVNEQDHKVGLVIKTINSDKHQESYINFLEKISGIKGITVISETLSREKMYGLINVCDSYVSLHRAEGFGLGMAEAMYLGKPVIGTAYSGNMDFMNKDNSILISFEMVDVEQDAYPFWSGQKWANPNVDEAAKAMMNVYSNISYAKKLGDSAKKFMYENHSFEVIGKKMASRLLAIEDLISKNV
jgi:glycosyltransferase involved in cell wall biosynthesis